MENAILNNGVKMPLLSFGSYQLRDGLDCEQSVLNALNIGCKMIDPGSVFHKVESVGRAIKKK